MKENEARKNIYDLFKEKKILSLKYVQGIIFHQKRPSEEQYFYEGILNKLLEERQITIFIGNDEQHYYQWIEQKNKKVKYKKKKQDYKKIYKSW